MNEEESGSSNINCLRQIIPLYTFSIDYHSWYYYGDPKGTASMLSIFPYLIQSEKEAVLLSETLDSALILTDEDSVRLLHRRFQEFLSEARPLVRKVDEPLQLIESLSAHVLNQGDRGYSFQMLPCVIVHLTPELIGSHVTVPPALMHEFGRILVSYTSTIQAQFQPASCFCMLSEEGVRRFLKTGRVPEYPDELYTPLTLSERKQLLQEIINVKPGDPMQHRMVKENIGNVKHGADIYVNQNSGYLLFRNPKNNQMVYLDILETSLLNAIFDYLNSMEEDLFYSQAEMKNRLRKIMAEFNE